MPLSLSVVFLFLIGVFVAGYHGPYGDDWIIVAIAAIVGGYMAINIGANDVANNMGPAVGGKVLTIGAAVVIAAICEASGALLAGGDVVKTVSKGIISPGHDIDAIAFRNLMLSALFSAALWINLATYLNAPVSTTHSIVGGVLGGGIAAAGFGLVNWGTMAAIAASWVISPVLGAALAALMLHFITVRIFYAEDHREAGRKWIPILIGLMAAALMAYMSLKGLKKIWHPGPVLIAIFTAAAFAGAYAASRPFINARVNTLGTRKSELNRLFNLPLIVGAAFLSFSHGANDVANAVGPLAAIVSTAQVKSEVASQVSIPLWVMVVGALGIAIGLGLFGPKLITVVGEKITRLTAPRAYCVALSAAVTVLIATAFGLPVSSTHIAVGAIFGVGFLREFMENPNKKKLRPGHKLNATAEDAFRGGGYRSVRRLVRRQFMLSIAAAWVITVPASAILAALIYTCLKIL